MKTNKGIIGIGLIVAIVLGIAVVGGGAYYVGKSSKEKVGSIKEENQITEIENQEVKQTEQNKIVESSSIKVLSPNGGEVYKNGDKILIKWGGVVKENTIAIYLKSNYDEWCFIKDVPATDTSYTFDYSNYICNPTNKKNLSGQYKVSLMAYDYEGMAPEPGTAFAGNFYNDNGKSIDSSDNYFTINSATKNVSTELPKYITAQEGWPPKILSSSADSYLCKIGNTEMEKTVEKIINGSTYCVKTFTEGAAGSSYVKYTYIKKLLNPENTKATIFTLRYTGCGGYGGPTDPTFIQCKSNQTAFNNNLDSIVDSLMKTN